MITFIFCSVYFSVCSSLVFSASFKRTDECNQLSEEVLSQILGPAYNSRYMSIDVPQEDDFTIDEKQKRKASPVPSFYVEDDYSRELADEPAWNVNHIEMKPSGLEESSRKKRAPKVPRQWECESRITWIDLGIDYFPRYLRSVECMSKLCWYGHYKCKPRSFTVKILRRKQGRCTATKSKNKIGFDGLPVELRELWVWEEKAVNFCCDCALP